MGVFNFEGNGVVLNIQAAMKRQDKYPTVLKVAMFFIVSLVAFFGSVSYAVITFHLLKLIGMG